MQPVPNPEPAGDFVQSLARGLAVIRAFDAEHAELTLSEVARETGISPAATRRFLRTLELLGYVRESGRRFSLTPRILELGFSYLSALSLPEVMQPHLKTLSAMVNESVSAAVLAGTDIVYVARVPTRRIMTQSITIGTRFPAYATSMGRVLLAAMSPVERDAVLEQSDIRALSPFTKTRREDLVAAITEVGRQGWAIVDGELEAGLRSAAVPVRGADGTVVAAINMSTSALVTSHEQVERDYLPHLLATANAVERDLAVQ